MLARTHHHACHLALKFCEGLNNKFNFFNCYRAIWIVSLFMSFCNLSFMNSFFFFFFHFNYDVKSVRMKLFTIFSHCPFSVYRICSNAPFPFDIDNLCFLFFAWSLYLRVYPFYWYFQRIRMVSLILFSNVLALKAFFYARVFVGSPHVIRKGASFLQPGVYSSGFQLVFAPDYSLFCEFKSLYIF